MLSESFHTDIARVRMRAPRVCGQSDLRLERPQLPQVVRSCKRKAGRDSALRGVLIQATQDRRVLPAPDGAARSKSAVN
jgi:hypothetical protein